MERALAAEAHLGRIEALIVKAVAEQWADRRADDAYWRAPTRQEVDKGELVARRIVTELGLGVENRALSSIELD